MKYFPVAKLRVVLHPVLGALHRHRRNTRRLALLHQIVFLKSQRPRLDALVQFLLILEPADEGVELGRSCPLGRAHHAHQAPPFIFGEAGDGAPVVVSASVGAVGVVGSGRWSPVVVEHGCSGPMGAVTRREPLSLGRTAVDRRVQHGGSVQGGAHNHLGQVHVLPLAGHIAAVERSHGGKGDVHSARVVEVGPTPASRSLAG